MNEIVRFIGRSADPHAIKIGNEAENLAQAIKFELPHEFKYATVFLHIQFGYYADVVNLGDDRIFKPTRTHTQKPGRYTAYLEVLIDGDVVWKSDVFYLHVGSLPNDGELIEKKYPTAFEEVMKTVASLTDISVEAETLPSGSNATVRLERDENGKAVLVYGLPQGEQGVSPTVDVKPINNGHRITVTDAEGVKTFDVSYGEVSQILTDRVVTLEQSMAEVKKITDNFELFVPKFANTAEGETLVLTDSAEGALQGMTVYGRTTQDGTPTPDAPVPLVSVGDDGAVEVTVAGKNLFNDALLAQQAGYNRYDQATGLWTTNANGGYHRSFLYNKVGNITAGDVAKLINIVPNRHIICTITEVAFSDDCTDPTVNMTGHDKDGNYIRSWGATQKDSSIIFELDTPANCYYLDIRRAHNAGTISFRSIQIEFGSTSTAYEPYKGQTLTLSTPNGLPSVGDVCDEIDLERGVYVQRVKQDADLSRCGYVNRSDASLNFVSVYRLSSPAGRLGEAPILCSDFKFVPWDSVAAWKSMDVDVVGWYANASYGIFIRRDVVGLTTETDSGAIIAAVDKWILEHGIKVDFIMDTPIETPLSAEEIAAFKALKTHYPTTTIYNDESAQMSVKYAADTKNYIDQKLATLAAAMVNNL